MSDLIDRQKAIDAILHITNCKSVRELFEYNQEHHLTEMWSGGVNDAIDAVIGVESATDTNVATKVGTNLASLGTDCISRQAAIDALKEHRALYCDNTPDAFSKLSHAEKSRVDELDTAIATLVNLPPAEPKRGRWIGKYPVTSVCSECGFLIHDSKVKVFAFCPNCGAKMEVNNESN